MSQTETTEAPGVSSHLCRAPLPRPGGVSAAELEIAATKLSSPAASRLLLSRPRLVHLLPAADPRETDDACITLLCGPAGCGKTTLLTDWAQKSGPDRAIAWLSLTADHDDVFLLWSSILEALEESGAWPEESALRRLSAPRHEVDAEFLAAFTAAFEQLQCPNVVLVLDDLHGVVARDAVATLDLLLRERPRGLRLVLSSRFVQLFSVARLRLEGKVREIDAASLEFSEQEAADLLDLHDVRLTQSELHQLLVRTEGWAAGLRLAAMWLGGAPQRAEMIADFARDDRAVADYLVVEVLEHQQPDVRQFLLATAICDDVPLGLAGVLSGRDDAWALLHGLERAHGLITRTGPDTYRYHPMLREYLRAELARRGSPAAHELHRMAAGWFEQRGQTMTAINHAADAEDDELLSRLLSRYGLSHITNGRGAALRRVLGRIPRASSVNQDPDVTLIQIAAALDAEDPGTVEDLLVRPEDVVEPEARDRHHQEVSAARVPIAGAICPPLSVAVALQRARISSDASAARALLAQDTSHTGQLDLDLLTTLERGATWLWLGLPDRAGAELSRALGLAAHERREWMSVRCLSLLSGAALAAGDFDTAHTRAAEALAAAAARDWSAPELCGTARLTSG
ncbi:MAG TPA: AAA family ATPase, partial [Actinomycetales bacterium]|nr:AAA family ATPase [Actinomycetales bacterium]